ncbi:MAG: 50S ribosomal protein L3 N(5)-glutamine methyltransferase [Pseudomonadales bacterium]|nr:50S ribosomal protein L3 N(5)-glutamine methyltransferase [Pseudomonadales bacterium]MDP6473155.1 50S ribosomal protein L3 N(5)-glutamine methyltransferase [Pseudomonadales bacterium]MDP6826088.1 50S ribosomal protein L3 N(5)-glutamine methyltransferase [Pseudomonadales bacterium]MDP6970379.1 50S ribosomal protein L3 N(5)-glutamine methyltransferase [Pseudomonadales bacterium]
MTVEDMLAEVSALFEASPLFYGHGTDNAWDEAVALVLASSGLTDHERSLREQLSPEACELIRAHARRRAGERIPLGYLFGKVSYCGLEFAVQPGVLIPRSPIGPWLTHGGLGTWLVREPMRILDFCCGSGCLGIVSALVFTEAEVVLADIDPGVCRVARENVVRHGLEARCAVIESDLFASLSQPPFDLVVCNPPYVDGEDMGTLPSEYRHEPELALTGGSDGLAVLRGILDALPEWLADGGVLVGEVGNSAPALLAQYPRLPFVWPHLPQGGQGVFLLEADALSSHTARRI